MTGLIESGRGTEEQFMEPGKRRECESEGTAYAGLAKVRYISPGEPWRKQKRKERKRERRKEENAW